MTDLPQIKVNLPNGKGAAYFPAETTPSEIESAISNLLIPSKSDAVARSFGSGALMNFGDEAAAGVRAAAPELSNWMMKGPALQRDESIGGSPRAQSVSTAPTFQGRYDEELAKERGAAKDFETLHPKTALASNIAGNVAGTGLAMMAAPAGVTSASPSLFANMGKLGATGAALGGVAGYGAGEGQNDRLASAIIGGGVGGGLGAAMPAAGAVGRAAMETAPGRWVGEKVVSPTLQRLASALGQTRPNSLSSAATEVGAEAGPIAQAADATRNIAQTGAVDRLATAMQRGRLSPESVERRLTGLGDEAMLADVDPQFRSLATGAKVLPGQTRSRAETVLEARDKNTGNRIVRDFEGNEPPPSSYDLRGEGRVFDQNLRATGEKAYGDMVEGGLRQTPELIEIQSNPIVSRAIDTVMNIEKQTRQGTSRAPASPVELMHKVKQSIWDLGFDQATARPGPNASFYRDLGTQYMDRLKAANPKLAEADRQYAQAASLPEFFDLGAAASRRASSTERGVEQSAPALADKIGGADPQQVLAARSGYTNVARDQAREGTDSARALAKRISGSNPQQSIIDTLYDPAQAQSIVRRAENEMTFAKTSNKLLRGSETAEKLSDAAEAGVGGIPIDKMGMLQKALSMVSRVTGPNEAVRDQIGHIMLNPNSAENQRILRLVAELMKSRATASPLRAGTASAAGSATANK